MVCLFIKMTIIIRRVISFTAKIVSFVALMQSWEKCWGVLQAEYDKPERSWGFLYSAPYLGLTAIAPLSLKCVWKEVLLFYSVSTILSYMLLTTYMLNKKAFSICSSSAECTIHLSVCGVSSYDWSKEICSVQRVVDS